MSAHPVDLTPGSQRRAARACALDLEGDDLSRPNTLTHLAGEPMTAPPGCRFFTVVRNIKPGVCMRLLVLNREGAETDLPETTARAIWEAAATPWELGRAQGGRAQAAAFDDEAA